MCDSDDDTPDGIDLTTPTPEPRHIWKGFIESIACEFNIYLINNLNGYHTLLVFSKDAGYEIDPFTVTKFSVDYRSEDLVKMVDSDALITTLIENYLTLVQQVKDNYGPESH